jgi:hypothetical protein
MSGSVSKVLLWLFVINLGIAFGAGFYEGRIVIPEWLGRAAPGSVPHWNAAAAARDDTGRRFWVFVTTIPLTLLTIANLVAAWRAPDSLRAWWLGAAGVALVERVFTLSYFIPKMVGLMRVEDSPESVRMAVQWAELNYVRHALVLIAWLAARCCSSAPCRVRRSSTSFARAETRRPPTSSRT